MEVVISRCDVKRSKTVHVENVKKGSCEIYGRLDLKQQVVVIRMGKIPCVEAFKLSFWGLHLWFTLVMLVVLGLRCVCLMYNK